MTRTPSSVSRKRLFIRSIFFRMETEYRAAARIMTAALMSSTGIATLSTELTLPPVAAESTMPATAISGAIAPMRRSRVRKD